MAELGVCLLAIVRVLESIEALVPDEKDGILRSIIAVLKNFATLGWKKKDI